MDFILHPSTVTAVAHTLIVISITVRVIMRRPATGVALAWLFLVAVLPFAGAVVYLLIGERRIGRGRARRIGRLRTDYEEITRAARASGVRIEEIVQAVREQARDASRVSDLMSQVNRSVEEIRAGGEEQERGNEIVMRGAVVMRDVAQQTHRTTEEQARGASCIRESMESVRGAVGRMDTSLRQQSASCSDVASSLEQIFERTRSNEDAARRLNEASQTLRAEAEALRQDVRRFRT